MSKIPVAVQIFSVRHEYQADAFARDAMGGPAALVAALRKLPGGLTPGEPAADDMDGLDA